MPQKKSIAVLTRLSMCSVGDFVGRRIQTVVAGCMQGSSGINYTMNDINSTIKQDVQLLETYLYRNVPPTMFSDLVSQLLTTLTHLSKIMRNRCKHQLSLCDLMMEGQLLVEYTKLVLNSHVFHLDLQNLPNAVREFIVENLNLVPNLRRLDYVCHGGIFRSGGDVIESNLNNLSHLVNLVCLMMNYTCTDAVLATIAEHCKKIQIIDCFSSHYVTDEGCPHLIKCKMLKELNLHWTKMSVDGYMELFLGCPHLTTVGKCDDFGRALQYIREDTKEYKQLNITQVHCKDLSSYQLYYLVEMCPKLEYLTMFHDTRINNLSVLSKLKQLNTLKLLAANFYTDGIKALLENIGDQLSMLHLEHVDEIDTDALIYISQFCPNLLKLCFYNCEFINRCTLPHFYIKITPFAKLQELMCVGNCTAEQTQFLLSTSTQLKSIHLSGGCAISDENLAVILTQNPLESVEVVRIAESYELSMNSVIRLVDSCSRLKVLTELEGWARIPSVALNKFRLDMNYCNMDLDTSPGYQQAEESPFVSIGQ